MSKLLRRAAVVAALAAAAAVTVPVGAASAATTGHRSVASATGAASPAIEIDGDYCGPTTQMVPGGAVYAKVCIFVYLGYAYAHAYVTVQNTGYVFGPGVVYINSGGRYYNLAGCIPPSHTVVHEYQCSTDLSDGSFNGYVQGQIELEINGGFYKAYSPTEPIQ